MELAGYLRRNDDKYTRKHCSAEIKMRQLLLLTLYISFLHPQERQNYLYTSEEAIDRLSFPRSRLQMSIRARQLFCATFRLHENGVKKPTNLEYKREYNSKKKKRNKVASRDFRA
jgi:hypothetical protein